MLMERHGTVVAMGAGQVQVRLDQAAGCAACTTQGGCGIGPLLAALRAGPEIYAIPVAANSVFSPGERVSLRLAAPRMLRAACLAYGPALLGLLGGAFSGAIALPVNPDLGAALGMGVGILVGLLGARRLARAYRDGPQLRSLRERPA
ncbi:MAG: SoxR reducing system RseC family protein [Gammaproteobacteria bacterium]